MVDTSTALVDFRCPELLVHGRDTFEHSPDLLEKSVLKMYFFFRRGGKGGEPSSTKLKVKREKKKNI